LRICRGELLFALSRQTHRSAPRECTLVYEPPPSASQTPPPAGDNGAGAGKTRCEDQPDFQGTGIWGDGRTEGEAVRGFAGLFYEGEIGGVVFAEVGEEVIDVDLGFGFSAVGILNGVVSMRSGSHVLTGGNGGFEFD
jgi:hypothetical protein